MTHSPAEVVRAVLLEKALGSSPDLAPLQAWPIYVGGEPGSPDSVITVYGTAGVDHGREIVEGEVTGPYGFQIRLRSNDYPTGRDKIETIWDTLSQSTYRVPVSVGSQDYFVHAIVRFGDILELGKESPNSKRSLFTFNAMIVHRKV